MSKPLRLAMPKTAEFVDAIRSAFGASVVDRALRNALAGGTDFFASENGQTIGNRLPPPGASFTVDQLHIVQHAASNEASK